jgi:hypothetical protein
MERTGPYADEVEETDTGDEEYEDDEQATPEAPSVDYLGWGAVLQWTLATAAGGSVLWGGLIPVITNSINPPRPYADFEPLAYAQFAGLVGVMGCLIGLPIGILQWLVWFRNTRCELPWIRATCGGLALSTFLITFTTAFLPIASGERITVYIARDIGMSILAGAVIGIFQGLAFQQAGIERPRFWVVATTLVYGSTASINSFYYRALGSSPMVPSEFLDFVPVLISMLVMFGGLSGTTLWAMINRPVIRRPGHVIAVALLLIASIVSAYVITITQPHSLRDPSQISITRQHYDEALAKWRAANVLEYELSLNTTLLYGEQTRRVRVRDQGRKIEILEPEFEAGAAPTNTDFYYRFYTVEGMFESLDEMLKERETFQHSYLSNWVTFNQELGYPAYIESDPDYEPRATHHERWTHTITDLKILKRGSSTAP